MKLLAQLGVTDKLSYSGGNIAITEYEKRILASKISKSQKTSVQYVINEARNIIAQ